MPLISQTPSKLTVYYVHYVKSDGRAVKDLPFGNRNNNVSYNNSMISVKNIPHSNVYTTSNNHSDSKPKIRLLSTKGISGKLFSKAKIISDSKRQTFLSPSPSQTDRTRSDDKKIKKIRFLRVPKPKPQNPQKPRSVGVQNVQNKVIQEYYIQPENNYSELNKKCVKSIVKKNRAQEHFNVDYQEAQLIKKKNMFTSSTGQILLKNLAYEGTNHTGTKSNAVLKARQTANLKKDSSKNFCFKIPKVTSVKVHNGVEIQRNQIKSSGQTSFFKNVKDEKKIDGYVSSFSRLIMKDKLKTLRSDELNLSNTIDKQSFGQLSLMSRN